MSSSETVRVTVFSRFPGDFNWNRKSKRKIRKQYLEGEGADVLDSGDSSQNTIGVGDPVGESLVQGSGDRRTGRQRQAEDLSDREVVADGDRERDGQQQ